MIPRCRSTRTPTIILVGWVSAALGWAETAISQSTEPVDLSLLALEDSGSYLVYRYEAVLPSGQFGVAALELDVASRYGVTEALLGASGRLRDFTTLPGAPLVYTVELGPISPSPWGALLPGDGSLVWTGVNNSSITVDSLAPGDVLSGLGIRSPFLPGLRNVSTWPTRQACCNEPWGTTVENPDRAHRNPDFFAATSRTVGPTYRPEELKLEDLTTELETVCGEMDWIRVDLCSELEELLGLAAVDEGTGNFSGAAAVLERLETRLVQEQADVHSNAYWLLKLNVAQVRANAITASNDTR